MTYLPSGEIQSIAKGTDRSTKLSQDGTSTSPTHQAGSYSLGLKAGSKST